MDSVGGHVQMSADNYLKVHPELSEYNTCTIRMSRAFNLSGQPIPGPAIASTYGMLVLSGQDKRWYAVRVAEFDKFLRRKYGPPTLSVGPTPNELKKLQGRKGIIEFAVKFSDATGHFDLWNGANVLHDQYFARSTQVNLWECS